MELKVLKHNTYLDVWKQRITEFKNKSQPEPIIIYTYDSLVDWLSVYPEQTIYLSPGVYWKQLPENDNNQAVLPDRNDLNQWLIKNKGVYEKYLIGRLKHEIANELGAPIMARKINESLLKPSNRKDTKDEKERKLVTRNEFKAIDDATQEACKEMRDNDLIQLYNALTTTQEGNILLEEKINPFDLNILYIDDKAGFGWEKMLRSIISDGSILGVISLETDKVQDYYDAIDEKDLGNYDVVILDLNLLTKESTTEPVNKRSGYNVLTKIRDQNNLIPVIMFTGSEKEINKAGLEDKGIVEFITKPYPGYEFSYRQAVKLLKVLPRIEENKWLKHLWTIYKTCIEKCNNPQIVIKFKAIMIKLYQNAYLNNGFIDNYLNRNQSLAFNECILYLHSIVTDIVQNRCRNIPPQDMINNGLPLDKICFKNVFINRFVFGESNWDNRSSLLIMLNDIRNDVYPIHGNYFASLNNIVNSLLTVIYEIALVYQVEYPAIKGMYDLILLLRKDEQVNQAMPINNDVETFCSLFGINLEV
jgi:CheY-like chemotaxis protein